MTKVKLLVTPQGIHGFTFAGHTGYADHGSDIVCAAVSVLAQTAVIGLTEVVGAPCEIKIKDGYLSCRLKIEPADSKWDLCQIVLETMHKGLTAIVNENEYAEFLSIREVQSL